MRYDVCDRRELGTITYQGWIGQLIILGFDGRDFGGGFNHKQKREHVTGQKTSPSKNVAMRGS